VFYFIDSSDRYVYHYTRSSTLLKHILPSFQIRLSKFSEVNVRIQGRSGVFDLPLQLRQHYPLLGLVLTLAVGVAGFADFIGLEEQDLAQAFVCVNARRQRRGV
jgi:hypothetical protein